MTSINEKLRKRYISFIYCYDSLINVDIDILNKNVFQARMIGNNYFNVVFFLLSWQMRGWPGKERKGWFWKGLFQHKQVV